MLSRKYVLASTPDRGYLKLCDIYDKCFPACSFINMMVLALNTTLSWRFHLFENNTMYMENLLNTKRLASYFFAE